MIKPHPPRLRMNRRNTVSVTPAIGASTVAGRITTPPKTSDGGRAVPARAKASDADAPAAAPPELSQYFRTDSRNPSPILPPTNKTPGFPGGSCLTRLEGPKPYFLTASPALPYLRRKRSTRPAVSISFCLPVNNGWHAAQVSTEISLFCVDRVTNWLPQAQCTRLSLYTG